MKMKQIIGLLVAVLVAVIIAFIPAPEGLTPAAMRYLGIFIAFIICMVVGVAPEYLIALGAVAAILITGSMKPGGTFGSTLAPFAGTTVWLILAGFGIAGALSKSGLLKRIALTILRLFPTNYTGQILAMLTTGAVISPMLPSTTAKAILLAPLSAEVSESAGFKKGSKGAGGLFAASYVSSGIFGNAFYTGSLYVAVMLGFVPEAQKTVWNFVSYLGMSWPWFVALAILTFVTIMIIYKPKEKVEFPKGYAAAQLKEMGKISRDEIVCGVILALAICLWIAQPIHKVDATVIGLAAFVCMAVFGGKAFTLPDLAAKIPWTVVLLIGGIMTIADLMAGHGIDKWLGTVLGPVLGPVVGNPFMLIIVVVIATYLLRYLVVSQIATGTIVIAVFSSMLPALGVTNTMLLAFMVYNSTQVWNLAFHNTLEIAARGATQDKMVDHKDTVKMSYAYMAINLIALLICVPVWFATGLLV